MLGKLVSAAALAGLVAASPIHLPALESRTSLSSSFGNGFGNSFSDLFGNSFSNNFGSLNFDEINFIDFSFNNFDNFNDFSNFDNFFGQSNFLGVNNQIVVIDVEQPTCVATDIRVIQQQLAILTETMKEIFLSEFCDVELQVITLEQLLGRMDTFSRSLRRETSFSASYDSSISVLVTEIVVDGRLNTNDFGFDGFNIGSNSVIYGGDNWGFNSISSVGLAYQLAHQSRIASLGSLGSVSNSVSSSPSFSNSSPSFSNSSIEPSSNSSIEPPSAVAPPPPPAASVDSNATSVASAEPEVASEVTTNGSGDK